MMPRLGDALKRLVDIVGACLALLLLSPVMLVVALLVRTRIGSPVLFAQLRPGLHGRPFRMLKFRSMSNATAPDGTLLPDDQRLSGFGRFLRRASIDELPELWCVVRGEMSLVGPRPLLMEYLPLYSPEQAKRHAVKPGVTGWAQVNGRNAISWEEKFALDAWYVEHRSLMLDLRILTMTLESLVRRRDDTSAPGEATMHRFVGSRSHIA